MWNFSKYSKNETKVKSKLDLNFQDKKGEEGFSLLREALQNAMDAKKSDKNYVKVRITLGTANFEEDIFGFDEFNNHLHLANEENGTEFKPLEYQDVPYILLEDFNTIGLDGGFDKENQEEKGGLVKFWWEEGISEKNKGSGGSHGVGKEMLTQSSASRLFFAYSKTENDELFFGFSRVGNHKDEGGTCKEYARFGVDGDNIFYPYASSRENLEKLGSLVKQCEIKQRTESEFGTSIFIPNIDIKHLNYEQVTLGIFINFYLPILKGILVVEINFEDKWLILNKDELGNILQEFDNKYLLKTRMDMASSLLADGGFFNTTADFKFEKGKTLNKDSFTKENFEALKRDYLAYLPVKFKFDMPLKPMGENVENGFFEIVIKKSNDEDFFYDVFRGEIRIKDEKGSTKKASVLLDVYGHKSDGEENRLSDFLKYCEDPGHTNWKGSVNRQNEKRRYNEVWQKDCIRFVASTLVNLLEGIEKEKVSGFADDIFIINKAVKKTETGQEKEDEADRVPPKLDIYSTPPLFVIDKVKNDSGIGFKIKPHKNLLKYIEDKKIKSEQRVEVKVAYEILRQNKTAWLKSAQFDIDLTEEEYFFNNIKYKESANKNSFQIKCEDTGYTEVTGFDANKNLHVYVDDKKLKKTLKEFSNAS